MSQNLVPLPRGLHPSVPSTSSRSSRPHIHPSNCRPSLLVVIPLSHCISLILPSEPIKHHRRWPRCRGKAISASTRCVGTRRSKAKRTKEQALTHAQVWADNLEAEFAALRAAIDQYPYISMVSYFFEVSAYTFYRTQSFPALSRGRSGSSRLGPTTTTRRCGVMSTCSR